MTDKAIWDEFKESERILLDDGNVEKKRRRAGK